MLLRTEHKPLCFQVWQQTAGTNKYLLRPSRGKPWITLVSLQRNSLMWSWWKCSQMHSTLWLTWSTEQAMSHNYIFHKTHEHLLITVWKEQFLLSCHFWKQQLSKPYLNPDSLSLPQERLILLFRKFTYFPDFCMNFFQESQSGLEIPSVLHAVPSLKEESRGVIKRSR